MHTTPDKSTSQASEKVVVTATALVTALGDDIETVWQRLLNRESAIRLIARFDVDRECYAAKVAALIQDLKRRGDRSLLIPLLDRLIDTLGTVPADAALIAATIKSGIDNLESICRGDRAAFEDILLSALGRQIDQSAGPMRANSGGPAGKPVCISASCASSAIAVAQGAAMITSGLADAVLICCADIVTEYVFSGFSCLKALSPSPCQPFDRDRRGLSLGEGAAALLLMSDRRAKKEGRNILGTIRGWGVSNDASHITAPARGGKGLIQAVDDALNAARIPTGEIAAICAHGTGTVYNDRMELDAFGHVFGRRKLPVFSVKGSLGHMLGAAGGVEIILSLKALAAGTVPPTVGFQNPDIGATGRVSADAQSIAAGCLLTTNSGFGGVNAAVVVGR
jgi:3-oxoacyl-(acyl-carrier-protein) synthase